jgi:heme-degrading monooxygenase HmoA
MFARKVSVRLKPDSLKQFTNLIDCEILPWLRKQPGFLHLIVLALAQGNEVATISFWDQEGNAQAFSASGYPQVLEVLEEILDGSPYVKTFQVMSSTFQISDRSRPHTPENVIPGPASQRMDCLSYETNV